MDTSAIGPGYCSRETGWRLGSEGALAVALLENNPVACAGVVPFRGPNWIDAANAASGSNEGASAHNVPAEQRVRNEDHKSSVVEDWELCCVCVHPTHRRTGLSTLVTKAMKDLVKQRGALRLNTVYSTAETGEYWLRVGFKTVPGAGGVLEKGFTVEPGLPGLLADNPFHAGLQNPHAMTGGRFDQHHRVEFMPKRRAFSAISRAKRWRAV
ncbi:uncharacterized protein RHO25_008225 [Cercospora beticola]|uniref:N-acetyltransferase domain-containing protein n=1 Tax=Cercospora beticola TaxID=122368 RepID=A0ABZ0NW23_CERBT|nr:hypothetical protein RHO25_008225 [Cercospora beticola]CAK1357671.1 unnamed protein product [Cercospora beticola]